MVATVELMYIRLLFVKSEVWLLFMKIPEGNVGDQLNAFLVLRLRRVRFEFCFVITAKKNIFYFIFHNYPLLNSMMAL